MFRYSIPLAAASVLTLAGCVHDDVDKELTPTPVVEGAATEDEATLLSGNVEVQIDGDPELPIQVDVEDEITPLHVKIKNDTGGPLFVRYQQLLPLAVLRDLLRALPAPGVVDRPLRLRRELARPALQGLG